MCADRELTFSKLLTLNPGNKMPRSPSRESVTTDLSLLSLSSFGSEISRLSRRGKGKDGERRTSQEREELGQSKEGLVDFGPRNFLYVPGTEAHLRFTGKKHWQRRFLAEVTLEEEHDLLKRVELNKTNIKLPKSYSTTDISNTINISHEELMYAVSESALTNPTDLMTDNMDEQFQRSRPSSPWTPDDTGSFKVPSVSDLLNMPHNGSNIAKPLRLSKLHKRKLFLQSKPTLDCFSDSDKRIIRPKSQESCRPSSIHLKLSRELRQLIRDDLQQKLNKQNDQTLTEKDVERAKGKPLSKYEQNLMIFNWLHSLDEQSFDNVS